mmetsp:Transcript_15636/g.39421  ORF Transcript_15636/g.39421 Transcript_15636/m.39421 type:complete len:298 (+) Transcript_15636:197-1090(+)
MTWWCRFRRGGQVVWGELAAASSASLPQSRSALLRSTFHPATFSAGAFQVDYSQTFQPNDSDAILPPVPENECPCVWAAGLNYQRHADETGMEAPRLPTLFMKSTTALNAPFGDIVQPAVCHHEEMDYEGELAIVIGKECKDVSVDDALDYVLGFCTANDVSSRRWQGKKGGGQWVRSKSYDTFLPLGSALVSPKDLSGHGQSLGIKTTLSRPGQDDLVVQNSSTADMIFSIRELVSFISQDTTLRPWTVILTGTPEGVGFTRKPPLFLQPGDTVTVEIEGLGSTANTVVAKPGAKL